MLLILKMTTSNLNLLVDFTANIFLTEVVSHAKPRVLVNKEGFICTSCLIYSVSQIRNRMLRLREVTEP